MGSGEADPRDGGGAIRRCLGVLKPQGASLLLSIDHVVSDVLAVHKPALESASACKIENNVSCAVTPFRPDAPVFDDDVAAFIHALCSSDKTFAISIELKNGLRSVLGRAVPYTGDLAVALNWCRSILGERLPRNEDYRGNDRRNSREIHCVSPFAFGCAHFRTQADRHTKACRAGTCTEARGCSARMRLLRSMRSPIMEN